MEEKTLIDRVQDAMLTDDEDREEQSEILKSIYEEQKPDVKNKIDEIFICLCGWSLETLLGRS